MTGDELAALRADFNPRGVGVLRGPYGRWFVTTPAGDTDTAWSHAREARRLAGRVGETNHYQLLFGPSNVAVHEVAAAVELGDDASALAVGDRARLSRGLPAGPVPHRPRPGEPVAR